MTVKLPELAAARRRLDGRICCSLLACSRTLSQRVGKTAYLMHKNFQIQVVAYWGCQPGFETTIQPRQQGW